MRWALVLMLVLGTAAAVAIPSAMQCPDIANAHVAAGWQEYRAGRLSNAQSAFASALARCPNHQDSQVGLGYVALRNMQFDSASRLFRRVLRANAKHVEAMVGLGLVQWRTEDYDSARATLGRALALDTNRRDIVEHLSKLPAPMGPPPQRPALVLPDTLVYHARVNGTHFEIRTASGWAPFYIKGINLGAALPGKFPSQFPDAKTYREWLRAIGQMGVNTVRVYTLHPPEFYDALAEYNAQNPTAPLHLIQGVWAELPPNNEYYDARWQAEFQEEMQRLVDVLHGRADVKQRAGHAAGYYTSDVAQWVLGFVLGREWEPFSVAEFNARRPTPDRWQGRYVGIDQSSAMDVWLTRAIEHIVAYETTTYRTQRPVAYTNWPTLDPMRHATELDTEDELTIRGIAFDRTRRNHNEDEVSIGAIAVKPTAEFPAGYFAAYHVYPYYPDFFLHDEGYAQAQSPWGASSYYGYLMDLRRTVPDVPIVIAEYGVPSSWGVAHFNPQGWHHGGHAEQQAAEINARLTREIAAAGMAGGVLFGWIDEWFKHSWLVAPFEKPEERNRMWWNRMNAEQHYGVLAIEPEPRLGETLADRMRAWETIPALYSTSDGTRIRAHADEAYLWVQVKGPARRAQRLVIGLDMIDADEGGMRFPGQRAPASPVGLEFVLQLDSGRARILADPGVNPFVVESVAKGATKRDRQSKVKNWAAGMFSGSYTQMHNEPYRSARPRQDGRFDPLWVVVNRARVGRDSTNYLGIGYDRGVLPQGPLPDGAWETAESSDAIEFRIPWNLINVTDPSSRHVVFEEKGAKPDDVVGTKQIEAIRIVAAAQDAAGTWRVWPATQRRADAGSFSWPTWDEPRYRVRRRPTFDAMREVFKELGTNNVSGTINTTKVSRNESQ